jgi:uncharacterized protein
MPKINEALNSCHVIAVVGLSSRRSRPSYGVSEYMQGAGYRIIPVNPNETEILGEKVYASLRSIPFSVDMVNIFRRPEAVMEIVEDAIAIGAKVIWMQEGVVNEAAADKARAAGLEVIMDRCLLKEHRKIRWQRERDRQAEPISFSMLRKKLMHS